MKKCNLISSVIIIFLIMSLFSTPAIASAPRQDTPDAIFDCTTVTDVPASECDVLVSLYASTDGANWTNDTNWVTSTTVEDWFGVTVSAGHVAQLDLYYNGLDGTIPTDLGDLTNMDYLRFNFNHLSGSIPSELGNLTNLTYFDLGNNQLTGGIPTSLGNLTKLTRFDVAGNRLDGGIPSQLGSLTALKELYLYVNQLSGSLPSELGNLTSLESLRINNNSLTGSIPSTYGSLTNLIEFYANNNDLDGSIPSELGSLSNLETLNLQNNLLSGSIPASFGNLSSLINLILTGNQLGGTIPSELGNLSNLVNLSASSNLLTGEIPSTIGTLANLRIIDFGSNDLNGSLPTTLGNLSALQVMNLYSNDFTGTIPSEFGNLTNLESMYLASNQLSGAIPITLGNLSNLTSLYLHQNQLDGAIPVELGNLDDLVYLYLYNNQLDGSIPVELGSLADLEYLYLQQNQLTGSVPSEIGNLSKLRYFYINNNLLNGSVPLSFTNLTVLDGFRFYSTSICEPATAEYLAWVATVADYQGTGISCSILSPKDEEKLTSSKVTFVWDPITDATKYKIQLSTKEDFSSLVFGVKTSTNTYPYLTSLLFGKTYYWRFMGYANGAWTSWETHKFYSMDKLAAPLLNGPADTDLLYPDFTLTWFPVTNAVKYQLQVARDSAFTDLVYNGKPVDTSKDFTGFANGKYYWRVKAIEAGGLKGPWSEVRSFRVTKVMPPVLTSPSDGAIVAPDVTLDWMNVPGAIKYKLQVAKDPLFTRLIVSEATTELYKDLTDLPERNFYWRVKAIDAEGNRSPWSEVWMFTVGPGG